jgi:hypothetical protein
MTGLLRRQRVLSTMCWACGHDLNERRHVALSGAPWVLFLHVQCILPLAWRLVAEWRAVLLVAEHQAS